MTKVAVRRPSGEPLRFHPLLSIIAFCLGVLTIFVIQKVFAQNVNPQLIYACIQKQTGNVRIVSINIQCRPDENSINWGMQGPPGPQGPAGSTGNSTGNGLPYGCNTCNLGPSASAFKGKDFSYAQIQNSDFTGGDMAGVIFRSAFFAYDQFDNTNLTGADFSNIKNVPGFLGNITNLKFTNANLTNANFSNSNFSNSDFSGANLTGTNFQATTGLTSSNTTGATWSNTTCPDGTNSNNNGNTCVGHF
jgi:hypothetical protein